MTDAGPADTPFRPAKNLASKVPVHRKTKRISRRNVLRLRPAREFSRPIFWPISQFLNRQPRPFALIIAITVAVSLTAACRRESSSPASTASTTTSSSSRVERGGEITASIRADPRSFNRFSARDTGTALFALLTQGKLVRVNQVTQEVEPWLAESWSSSDDGLRVT